MLFAAAVISIASAYKQHGNGSMPQSLLFSPDSFKLGTPYPGNGPDPATLVAPASYYKTNTFEQSLSGKWRRS